jgi:hypothetical protein
LAIRRVSPYLVWRQSGGGEGGQVLAFVQLPVALSGPHVRRFFVCDRVDLLPLGTPLPHAGSAHYYTTLPNQYDQFKIKEPECWKAGEIPVVSPTWSGNQDPHGSPDVPPREAEQGVAAVDVVWRRA